MRVVERERYRVSKEDTDRRTRTASGLHGQPHPRLCSPLAVPSIDSVRVHSDPPEKVVKEPKQAWIASAQCLREP